MTGLDIATPKGQETLLQEQRAAAIFSANAPGWLYAGTPKEKPGKVDAALIHEGTFRAIVETKCRDVTLETFIGPYRSEWLVTHSKILTGIKIAQDLCVDFYGFLYLVPSDVLLIQWLFRAHDGAVFPFRVETTETQRTVNGGTAIRENAFIAMNNAKSFRGADLPAVAAE